MTLPAEPQLAADVVLVFDFIEISLFSLCNLLSQAFDEKKTQTKFENHSISLWSNPMVRM